MRAILYYYSLPRGGQSDCRPNLPILFASAGSGPRPELDNHLGECRMSECGIALAWRFGLAAPEPGAINH